MHALAAHATRLALLPLHFALLAAWRPLLIGFGAALAARGLKAAPGLAAACGILAGWVALSWPGLQHWPQPADARYAGLAAILAAEALLSARGQGGWWLLPASAALGAWWIRGAPLTGAGIVNTMPVFLGLAAALPLSRRLCREAQGMTLLAGVLALAGALAATGAPGDSVRAALVAGAALLPLLGQSEAGSPIAGAVVLTAALMIGAHFHEQLTVRDLACLAPLAVWAATPGLSKTLARSGPAAAALIAATACIALAWVAAHGGASLGENNARRRDDAVRKRKCSFLKKRTKKLLLPGRTLPESHATASKNLFASISSEKEESSFSCCSQRLCRRAAACRAIRAIVARASNSGRLPVCLQASSA